MADAASGSAPYLVTARKYRPQTFGDMVGQEHVARTLQNAIRLDRLAHAYLFSGPRGVGKTTAARILAKAVNCQTTLKKRDGAEPCRTCDACRAFEAGRSLNIIELDAASNNGVDDVRELRDTVRIPPQGANKKVYILDEVHMMSKAAFNALLKTLEEPPPHALFVFATTEPHKVLPTILSRTQRFDFRRIAVPAIMSRLEAICKEEGFEADDEALLLLARRADGALRDALSLFDQAIALCGTPLDAAGLRDALGVVDTDLFFEATEKIAAHDRAGVLGLVDRLVTRGYDLAEFLGGLAEHLRALLVAASTGSGDLLEATEAGRKRYLDAAATWTEADLLHLLMIADEADRHLKDLGASRQPRLTTELALLKMASLAPVADLQQVLGELEALRARLDSGAALPTTTAPAEATTSTPTATAEPTPSYRPPAVAPEPTPTPEAPAAEPPPAAPEDFTATEHSAAAPTPEPAPMPEEEAPAPRDEDEGGIPEFSPEPPRHPAGPAPSEAAPPAPAPPPIPGLFSAPALKRRTDTNTAGGDGAAQHTDDASALAIAPSEAATPAAPTSDFDISLTRVRDAWPALVERIKAERVHVGALLQLAEPHRTARGAVEVAVPDDFGKSLLESEADAFRVALDALLGERAPALRFVVRAAEKGETVVAADPFERLKQLRQEHPVIRTLFERFGAEIVW